MGASLVALALDSTRMPWGALQQQVEPVAQVVVAAVPNVFCAWICASLHYPNSTPWAHLQNFLSRFLI